MLCEQSELDQTPRTKKDLITYSIRSQLHQRHWEQASERHLSKLRLTRCDDVSSSKDTLPASGRITPLFASAVARVGLLRFVWQGECFSHIDMQRRNGFCDCSTRPIRRFRDDALRHFWPSAHLYLRRPACLLSFVLAVISVSRLLAQTNSPASDGGGVLFEMRPRQYLFGDWGGKRTALEEKGVKFDFFYIADLEANPSGGLQQTKAGWERIRGTIDVNFDELMKWQGLRFHTTGLWQVGANLGAKIGTLANPSDLVSAHTTRLDSFWLEQHFLNSKVRLRAGQLAGLDVYGNQEYGGSWLIEPMGYAFGNLFSSIFESFNPAGTPGAEIRFAPKRSVEARTGRELNVFSAHVTRTIVKAECRIQATIRSGIGPENGLASHTIDQVVPAGPLPRIVRKFAAVINAAKFVRSWIGLASSRGCRCLRAV